MNQCGNPNDQCKQNLLISSRPEAGNYFFPTLLVDKTVLMSINYVVALYSYPLLLYQLTPKDISSPLQGTDAGVARSESPCSLCHASSLPPCWHFSGTGTIIKKYFF